MSLPLIVGAGPTGLSAALFLADRGVPTRVIEKRERPSEYSKAFAINPRTLTLLGETEVADKLLEQGRRAKGARIYRDQEQIGRIRLAFVDGDNPFMTVFPQSGVEKLLTEALESLGGRVERGVELIDVAPQAGGATLAGSNGREDIEAPWILAADGASSTLRKLCGIDFPGLTYEESWQLIDAQLEGPLDQDDAHIFLLDDGVAFLLRIRDDIWRLAGNVTPLPDRLPPGARLGEVVWESEFRISNRLAERFVEGRVYLAGDAAHIHSPLGGRGMNLGVEDAYVFANLAAEDRLADYEELRRPVDQAVVEQVARLTSIPRGRSFSGRLARPLAPLLARILPLAEEKLAEWLLGLDHDVRLRPPAELESVPG